MKQEQGKIWREHIKNFTMEDVIAGYKNPAIFQKELKSLIDSYSRKYKNIIEVGCEIGTTSFILDDSFNKTLLDLNPLAIDLAKKAFRKMNKEADFVVADMFDMPFEDKSFDIVFNAGVVEHFDQLERTRAMKEYSRILRDNGVMIIAFPNHYSIPYCVAYIIRNIFGKWPYPKEYRIYDMREEIEGNNLILEKRVVISRGSILNWLDFFKPLKLFFRIMDKFFKFEGYLTVLIIKKNLNL